MFHACVCLRLCRALLRPYGTRGTFLCPPCPGSLVRGGKEAWGMEACSRSALSCHLLLKQPTGPAQPPRNLGRAPRLL